MSDKLTEQKIEEMIEQLLQEKINVKIKGQSWRKVKKDLGGVSTKYKTITDIAGFDGDADELQDLDFEIGYSTQPGDSKRSKYKSGMVKQVKKLAKDPELDPNIKKDIDAAKAAAKAGSSADTGGGTGGGTYPTYDELLTRDPVASGTRIKSSVLVAAGKKAIADFLAKPADVDAMKAMQDYADGIARATYGDRVTAVATDIAATLRVPPPSGGIDPLKTTRIANRLNSLLDVINKGIEVKDRSFDAFGAAPRIQSQAFQSSPTATNPISKTDSSTIAAFRGIAGDTIEGKFNALAEFSNKVANNTFPDDLDAFQIANYSMVYSYFADLSRNLGSTTAGDTLEAIIALAIEGTQVGAGGAGEDIIAGAAANRVFYSSKFLNLESGTIDQSWEDAGLSKILSTTAGQGKPVYYVFARKSKTGASERRVHSTDEDQDYTMIDVWILRCEPDAVGKAQSGFENGTVSLVETTGDLKQLNAKWKTYTKDSVVRFKISVGAKVAASADFNHGNATCTIQVPTVSENGLVNTANHLTDVISKSSNELLKNIKLTYDSLTNIQLNTREYTAVQGKLTDPADYTEYIKQISDDFVNAKSAYKDVFQQGSGDETKFVAESKLQSLDDLIAEAMRDIRKKRK